MLRNTDHEEYLARRARLGIAPPPPPIVKLIPRKRDIVDLYEHVKPSEPEPISHIYKERWKVIIHECAAKHEISVKDMLSDARWRKFARARQEACYRMVMELGMSYPAIARRIGYMDHTSAISAAAKHAELYNLPLTTREPKGVSKDRNKRMYEMASRGASYREVSEAFGLSIAHVNNLCVGYARANKLDHPHKWDSKIVAKDFK